MRSQNTTTAVPLGHQESRSGASDIGEAIILAGQESPDKYTFRRLQLDRSSSYLDGEKADALQRFHADVFLLQGTA